LRNEQHLVYPATVGTYDFSAGGPFQGVISIGGHLHQYSNGLSIVIFQQCCTVACWEAFVQKLHAFLAARITLIERGCKLTSI